MIEDLKKITQEDYIPDMITTLNDNFDRVKEAIADLEELTNNGDAELKSLKVNIDGDVNAVSYQGRGKMVNNGSLEITGDLKAAKGIFSDAVNLNSLNVSSSSTFEGEATFNQKAVLVKASLAGAVIAKARQIDSLESANIIGAVNGSYNITVASDFIILVKTESTNLDIANAFNFINPVPSQIIYIVNTNSSANITIKLSSNSSTQLAAQSSLMLLWNELQAGTGIGEWVVISK